MLAEPSLSSPILSRLVVHVSPPCARIYVKRGHGPILVIRGCDTDELERAANELEKATNELVKRAAELARRSEELNRQLLKLAEALTRPTMITPGEAAVDPFPPAKAPESARPSPGNGILAEVKELLDGPGGHGPRSWADPRD
jgi:hypothetical protein